jgi:hypothetical protein
VGLLVRYGVWRCLVWDGAYVNSPRFRFLLNLTLVYSKMDSFQNQNRNMSESCVVLIPRNLHVSQKRSGHIVMKLWIFRKTYNKRFWSFFSTSSKISASSLQIMRRACHVCLFLLSLKSSSTCCYVQSTTENRKTGDRWVHSLVLRGLKQNQKVMFA